MYSVISKCREQVSHDLQNIHPLKAGKSNKNSRQLFIHFHFISQFIPPIEFLSIVRYSVMPRFSKTGSLTCEMGDSCWYEKKKLFIEDLYKYFKKNNKGWKWCYEGHALSIAVGITVLALLPANGANFLFR